MKYENGMLAFLEIENISSPELLPPNGSYKNEELNLKITVDGFTIIDPNGKCRKITPKTENEFYVECLPVVLRFEESGHAVMTEIQICERWTTMGIMYTKSI